MKESTDQLRTCSTYKCSHIGIITISLSKEETEAGKIRQQSFEEAMSLDSYLKTLSIAPGMARLYSISPIPCPAAGDEQIIGRFPIKPERHPQVVFPKECSQQPLRWTRVVQEKCGLLTLCHFYLPCYSLMVWSGLCTVSKQGSFSLLK